MDFLLYGEIEHADGTIEIIGLCREGMPHTYYVEPVAPKMLGSKIQMCVFVC
jgi:hypothetical protein